MGIIGEEVLVSLILQGVREVSDQRLVVLGLGCSGARSLGGSTSDYLRIFLHQLPSFKRVIYHEIE